MADYFKMLFKENLLYDGVYVEPYAGGASVALSLLFNEYASKIIINDIDRSIYAFWYSVLYHTNAFCDLIQKTELSYEEWLRQKDIQRNKSKFGILKVGFSTFYLNRTNRSGILNAGIIGGKAQNGNWKMDARFNKNDLISRIRRISSYKERIELYNLDAVQLVKELSKSLPKKCLFYFDPPYFIKGKDLYLNYYKLQDHVKISKVITGLKKQNWVVTYDNVPEIEQLYIDNRRIKFNLNYSAGKASKGQELMFFSQDLFIPSSAQIL
jgi:DNA adenine methylase